MRRASLPLLPGLCLLAGCVPVEQPGGLPTVSSNLLGTPPPGVIAAARPPDAELAARVYFTGRDILAENKNCGLDAHLTFVTYPAPTVEIFHPDRTHIYVTEGLVRKCTQEQLAAMLALEMGKLAAERLAAAPYLDTRSLQEPIRVPADAPAPPWFYFASWGRLDGQQSSKGLPEPRQLAAAFLERARYSKNCLDAASPLIAEAGQNHNIEMRLKGMPVKSDWLPGH